MNVCADYGNKFERHPTEIKRKDNRAKRYLPWRKKKTWKKIFL